MHVQRHHIIPRARFDTDKRSEADALANIAFIAGETNRAISDTDSERYLATISGKILASQCIPPDKKLWTVEAAPQFWEQRRVLVAEAFNEFVDTMLENRRFS